MKPLSSLSKNDLAQLHDYIAYDHDAHRVGSIEGVWTEARSGKVEFLGVRTGWIFGKNHITPAVDAQIDERNRCIYLSFSEQKIKEAPTFSSDMVISDTQEEAIYEYYGLRVERSPVAGLHKADSLPKPVSVNLKGKQGYFISTRGLSA